MSSDEPGPSATPAYDDLPGVWTASDPLADLTGMNMFTDEIDNIDASDWDVDSDSLWGSDDGTAAIDPGDGLFDTDFPI